MSKLALSLLSLLCGLAVGVLLGYALFSHRAPLVSSPNAEHFFYQLSDSTIARHTVSVSNGRLEHTVDTLTVHTR
jgi:hypothetical protein